MTTATTAAASPSRSAWLEPRFVVFAAGNTMNNVGESMYAIALPLLVLDRTGSLGPMAALAAMAPLGLTLGGPVFGAVVDRYGSRVLVLPGLLVQFAAALTLNVLLMTGSPGLATFFAAEFLVQLGAAAYRAGWMAGIPAMFADAGRARGALSSCYQASVVIGPVLAAALYGVAGPRGLLWINLLTFVAPMVVWAIGINPKSGQVRTDAGPWNVLADLRAGWAALRSSRQAYALMLVLVPASFIFGTGTLNLVLFYLRDDLGLSSSHTSAVVAIVNVGALLAAIYVAERPRKRVGLVAGATLLASGACFFALPAIRWIPLAVGVLVVLFMLDTAVSVASEMVMYATVPAEAIGRSLGFWRLVLGGPQFVSPLVIAGISRWSGLTGPFLLLGAVAAVPGVWALCTMGRTFASQEPGAA